MARKQVFWSVGAPLASYAAYVALVVAVPETWRLWLISEVGPIELGTAALFLAAAGVAMVLAWRAASVPPVYRALFCLFALGGVFVALEELSYGQHMAGWSSPEWVAERNARQETNLHNLYDNFISRRMRTAANLSFPLMAVALPLFLRRRGSDYRPGSVAWFLLPQMQLACLSLVAAFCTAPQKIAQQ